jgi:hypothetical protein
MLRQHQEVVCRVAAVVVVVGLQQTEPQLIHPLLVGLVGLFLIPLQLIQAAAAQRVHQAQQRQAVLLALTLQHINLEVLVVVEVALQRLALLDQVETGAIPVVAEAEAVRLTLVLTPVLAATAAMATSVS